MKKASFAALVYRELLLCRKALGIYLTMNVVFSLIPVLAGLSIRFGNMAMLPQNILADFRANNDIILKLCAVISPCMLILSVSETAVFDTLGPWSRFRKSTPVPPERLALAKSCLQGIFLVISLILALAAVWLCCLSLGIRVTWVDVAVIMALITVMSLLAQVAQLWILALRSVDYGMLAAMATLIPAVFLLPEEWKANFNMDYLLPAAEKLLPATPLILLGILGLSWLLTVMIFKRREK